MLPVMIVAWKPLIQLGVSPVCMPYCVGCLDVITRQPQCVCMPAGTWHTPELRHTYTCIHMLNIHILGGDQLCHRF